MSTGTTNNELDLKEMVSKLLDAQQISIELQKVTNTKIDSHDNSSQSNFNSLIEKNERLNTKVNVLLEKNELLSKEVKSNSSIQKYISLSSILTLLFSVCILLNIFADYNLGTIGWYRIGLIISISAYLISFFINKKLQTDD